MTNEELYDRLVAVRKELTELTDAAGDNGHDLVRSSIDLAHTTVDGALRILRVEGPCHDPSY